MNKWISIPTILMFLFTINGQLPIVQAKAVELGHNQAVELGHNHVNPLTTIPAVREVAWPTKEDNGTFKERVYIVNGTTQVLRLDRPIKRITVSDNTTIGIRALGPSEILIHAKQEGRANVIIWDEMNVTATLDVQSVIDIKMLTKVVQKIAPDSDLEIVPYRDSVAVVGDVRTIRQSQQIEQAVLAVAGQDSYSFVRVKDAKQVLLEVRFAEVDRTAAREFGFDASFFKRYWLFDVFTGRNAPSRSDDTTLLGTVEGAAVSRFPFLETPKNDVNIAISHKTQSADVDTFLQALITKSILKLIARPNLLARDGEEARFVVGGEIPFVTTSNNGTNVEYKEFGTRLVFTPIFLDSGKIRLETVTTVSELDFNTTISLQGTSAPTIIKTEHKTVAELKDGQSLVVGGLITQRITKTDRKVPVLGDIPLISKMFRDESFSRKDVELLLVITPRVVNPYVANRRPDPFPPVVVEKAVQTSYPAFPEEQADLMNVMMTNDEDRPTFQDEDLNNAVEVTKEISKTMLDLKRFGSFLGLTNDHEDIYKKTVQNEKKQAKYVEVLYEAELADLPVEQIQAQHEARAVEEVLPQPPPPQNVVWEEPSGSPNADTNQPAASDQSQTVMSEDSSSAVSEGSVQESAYEGFEMDTAYNPPPDVEPLYESTSDYDEDDLLRQLSEMNGDEVPINNDENGLPPGF